MGWVTCQIIQSVHSCFSPVAVRIIISEKGIVISHPPVSVSRGVRIGKREEGFWRKCN